MDLNDHERPLVAALSQAYAASAGAPVGITTEQAGEILELDAHHAQTVCRQLEVRGLLTTEAVEGEGGGLLWVWGDVEPEPNRVTAETLNEAVPQCPKCSRIGRPVYGLCGACGYPI